MFSAIVLMCALNLPPGAGQVCYAITPPQPFVSTDVCMETLYKGWSEDAFTNEVNGQTFSAVQMRCVDWGFVDEDEAKSHEQNVEPQPKFKFGKFNLEKHLTNLD